MSGYGTTFSSTPPTYYQKNFSSSISKNDSVFARGQRRRMNIVAVLFSLFLPWGLFSAIFAVMSCSYHYKQPAFTYFIVALGFLAVVTVGIFAADSIKKKSHGDPTREPNWYVFLFLTCFLAWVLAVVGGDMNYAYNMQPYFDVLNLNQYMSVDVSRMRGQQLMDAGRVVFAEGTRLDISRSVGFRNQQLYCVAPISNAVGNETLATYDFWAVGMDCCSGIAADFHCKNFNNPEARGALRLMKDEQRAYYRLAVQQAEATYGIKAVHPLFFEWMQDPIEEVSSWAEDGLQNFLCGVASFFVLQLFLTATAALSFSKLGHM